MTLGSIINIVFLNSLFLCTYIINGYPENFLFLITNYLIIFISILGIFYKPQEYYSLFKFFYLFSLLFFGIIPYLDNINNIYYWGGSDIDIFYYIIANIVILSSISLYWVVYSFFKPSICIESVRLKEQLNVELINKKKNIILMFLFLLSFLSAFGIFYYRDFIFLNLFFRDTLHANSRIELLIVSFFLTPMPIIIVLFYNYVRNITTYKFTNLYMFLFLLIALIFVFPTSTARFFTVAMYLAIILSLTNILDHKYRIQYSLFFGVFLIFPLLDKFRFLNNLDKIDLSINFHFLQAGHFDAYQNFVRLISIDYISYGYQLYGPLAFFVPRSILEDKPIGSGHLLASLGNLDFANISMPLIAEGYINFGIIGSLIFIALFGFLSKYLDFKYWTIKKHLNNHIFFPKYFLFLGLSLFIMRGDLMSSFAYSITIIGVYHLISQGIILAAKKNIILKKRSCSED